MPRLTSTSAPPFVVPLYVPRGMTGLGGQIQTLAAFPAPSLAFTRHGAPWTSTDPIGVDLRDLLTANLGVAAPIPTGPSAPTRVDFAAYFRHRSGQVGWMGTLTLADIHEFLTVGDAYRSHRTGLPDSSSGETGCCICYDNPAVYAAVVCGHVTHCGTCYRAHVDANSTTNNGAKDLALCPLCRTITAFVRLIHC